MAVFADLARVAKYIQKTTPHEPAADETVSSR
jgi:hypothetical protein